MEVFQDYRKVKVLNGTIERYIIVCISCLVKNSIANNYTLLERKCI